MDEPRLGKQHLHVLNSPSTEAPPYSPIVLGQGLPGQEMHSHSIRCKALRGWQLLLALIGQRPTLVQATVAL